MNTSPRDQTAPELVSEVVHSLEDLEATDEKEVFHAGQLAISTRAKRGAVLIVRAWRDDSFRHRLLHSPKAAALEEGIDLSRMVSELVVLEDQPDTHNIIVCTLCSCYPKPLLGPPPDWYKSVEYRSRVVRNPRGVLAEMGTEIPASVAIRVSDSTADRRFMVLPNAPIDLGSRSNDELEESITPAVMIGTELLEPWPRGPYY